MKNRKSAIVGMLRDAIMRPESIPFNVNHDVRVRLHDEGKRIYQDMWGTAPRVDAQGWTRFQMWGFMSLFGPHLLPTMSPPFDPRIELLPENAEMRDRHLEQTPPEKGNVQNEN